ncbi:MAG: M1 family metallopeptidase [Ilumatobacteraceae bacterium]
MQRRTGGLVLVACLGVYLAACATSSGVVSTEARSGHASAATTTIPVVVSTSPTESTSPADVPATSDAAPTSDTRAPVTPIGDDGIGDALFPALGNPGIDVEHYDIVLDYDPVRTKISATVHLDVLMTEERAMFSLDSDGPVVSDVTVDGVQAKFVAAPPELLITPATKLSSGQRIGVDVSYTLVPGPVPSAAGDEVGWFPTRGGSYVLNEPEGAHTWIPCDDHPSDQATFRFELTVPSGLTAVANGGLLDHTSTVTTDTWIWQEDRPMATYLIQLLTGDYEIVDGVGPNGLPLLSVVLRNDRDTMQAYLDSIDDQIDYFDDYFGTYPLDRYGIAITDSAPGLAMETMERPTFSRGDFSNGRLDGGQQKYLSHELAHQWFGNAVSPERWTDIWLNESFAMYGEWMWLDHVGMQPIDSNAAAGLANREPRSTAHPRVGRMFKFNSYEGGAVVLHALRKTIGDDLFFALLRRWVVDNNGSSRTTEDFVALANEVAGQDLTEFFSTWLYADKLPATFPV